MHLMPHKRGDAEKEKIIHKEYQTTELIACMEPVISSPDINKQFIRANTLPIIKLHKHDGNSL